MTNGNKDYYRKAKRTKWIDHLVQSCVEYGQIDDPTESLFHYLNKEHGGDLPDALSILGLATKHMSEYQMTSTMKATGSQIT